MLLTPSRPYGPRMVKGSPIKLKGVFIVTPVTAWPPFWVDWATSFALAKKTIDYAVTQGFNAFMCTANGITDGTAYPNDADLEARIAELCAYVVSKGCVMLPQIGHVSSKSFGVDGSSLVSGTATSAKVAAMWARQPGISMIDVMNEANNGAPTTWTGANQVFLSDIDYYISAIRAAVGNIPLSCSLVVPPLTAASDIWLQALEPFVDVINIHTYGTTPAAATDLANLYAAPWYSANQKPVFIGETGRQMPDGDAAVTAWLQGSGTLLSDRRVAGACLYAGTKTAYNDYGLLDETGANPRAAVVAGCAGWPALL